MFNYILVGLGVLLGSNLIVGNIITSGYAYIFSTPVNTAFIIFISLCIGIGTGFGIRGILSNSNNSFEEDDDGYNF